MIKTKKQMYIVIGVFALVLMLGTVTYAFFNYTRTGTANTISTGRIAFNASQNGSINLTNAFPISSTQALTDTTNAKSVAINVVGDTDYTGGLEYLVTASDVNLTVGSGQSAKTLPIAIEVSVSDNVHGEEPNQTTTTLGTAETGDYYTNRTSYSVSKYKVLYDGELTEGSRILAGYIAPNTTAGTIEGIDGVINIKAYIDSSKILISDTYYENATATPTPTAPNDEYGTPSSMAEGKVVFTTTEWNNIQGTPLSFKVKVEANEEIWVQSPYADPNNYAANIKCQRVTDATKLHTETCSQTGNYYCAGDGYTGDNTTITYGNAKLIGTDTLTVGDAFDCDVDGDGVIDKDGNGNSTERFYYVSPYYNTNGNSALNFDDSTGYATLIYYKNFVSGSPSDSGAAYATAADIQAIDSNVTSYDNWHGPVTAVKHLPTTSTWSNIELKTTSRTILACDNGNCSNTPVGTTNNGSNTITNPFSYEGKAGRLLTVQEIKHAGCDTLSSKASLTTTGALTACNFLLEGTAYADSSKETYGPWLETPQASNSFYVWPASVGSRCVYNIDALDNHHGVRPAIDVAVDDILK